MSEMLETIGRLAREHLALKHDAREKALPKSRAAIRFCANSIRAVHRHEFEVAVTLRGQAEALLSEATNDLLNHQDILYAGFIQDAQKEYVEATTFAALVQGQDLPEASALHVTWAAYLNGLGEAVGELRRYLLDQLRRGQREDCEVYLASMDEIYALLTTIDFPDAITSGLRRTTDTTRSILEKTRGDLTTALSQAQLQQEIVKLLTTLDAQNQSL